MQMTKDFIEPRYSLQEKFKRIEELAKSGIYERNIDSMWTTADLIASNAKAILRQVNDIRKQKKEDDK